MKLRIAETKDYFVENRNPFFYLADTVWTAFSNIPVGEWEEYLAYRRTQGFNAYQANILHQWDGGEPDLGRYPFARLKDGRFDFTRFNDEYFEYAQKLVAISVKMGFLPALVVLWADYVPDTQFSKKMPERIMPLERVVPYVEHVARLFGPFDPVFIVSGDTDIDSPKTKQYYLLALETLKRNCPDALTTMHLGPETDLPEEFVSSRHLDFYMYQSGHRHTTQHYPYYLAQRFYQKPVKRPVVNGEPCYEHHYFGGQYGRYNAFNVRKAVWQSLLSGAKAGVTYGAHGLWAWYREGKPFLNETFGGRPHAWRKGLEYKGAWDASFAKWIFETFGLFDLEPQVGILNDTEEIRLSASRNLEKIAVYVPYNTDVRVKLDLSGYEFTLINLSEKLFAKPTILREGESWKIQMHDFNSDALLIGKRH